jgi:hypothetical protein
MQKSTRHAKLTGDFAESILLYWLSKFGHECARIDHTGIDLIARDPAESMAMGFSVKCRSRYSGTESTSVTLPTDGFEKARAACAAFNLVPFYGIVVDGAATIRCYLVSLDHLESLLGTESENRYWQMSKKWLVKYETDTKIKRFELCTTFCSWSNG